MRVLVTGIEGFVGGHLARRLEELGHEVWGTVLEPGAVAGGPVVGSLARRENAIDSLRDPHAGPLEREAPRLACDVRNLDAVRDALRASRAEAIVHLAGRSSVAESHADPLGTYRTNVEGALNVLEAAREARLGGPILLVGSGEVYGRSDPSTRMAEHAPARPLSAYAASKAAQELVGAQYARTYGLRVVLTRSFAHTGAGQDDRFVLPSFARQAAALVKDGGRGEIRVGNLAPVRDYLDVRDVASAYALLLERGEAGAVLNVCSGQGFSLREYLEELLEIAGVEAAVREDPDRVREVDVERLVGDPSALIALGWRPEITKHDMLKDLLDYWRERV